MFLYSRSFSLLLLVAVNLTMGHGSVLGVRKIELKGAGRCRSSIKTAKIFQNSILITIIGLFILDLLIPKIRRSQDVCAVKSEGAVFMTLLIQLLCQIIFHFGVSMERIHSVCQYYHGQESSPLIVDYSPFIQVFQNLKF